MATSRCSPLRLLFLHSRITRTTSLRSRSAYFAITRSFASFVPQNLTIHVPMVNVATTPDILHLVEKRLRLTTSDEIRKIGRRNSAFITRRYASVAWLTRSTVAKMHETSILQLESRVWSREFSSIGVHVRSVSIRVNRSKCVLVPNHGNLHSNVRACHFARTVDVYVSRAETLPPQFP